jgi:hypothetical protein
VPNSVAILVPFNVQSYRQLRTSPTFGSRHPFPAVLLRAAKRGTRLGSRGDDVRTRVRQTIIRLALDVNSLRSPAFMTLIQLIV